MGLFGKRNEIQQGDSLYGPNGKKARAASAEYYDEHDRLVVDIRWLITGGEGPEVTLPASMFTPTRNF